MGTAGLIGVGMGGRNGRRGFRRSGLTRERKAGETVDGWARRDGKRFRSSCANLSSLNWERG